MKKTIIVILVVFVAVIGSVILLALFLTSDIANSADEFFSAINNGSIEEAYQSTSREFQAATSLEAFKSFLNSTAIASYESASWSSRSKENNIGKLEGSIKTKDGGIIPVKIQLVKEDNKWKILNINKAEGGLIKEENAEKAERQKKEIPAENELIEMTNRSVLSLAEAIVKDDFTDFYNSVSNLWQNQTNPGEIRNTFKQFIEQNIDMRAIKNLAPVYKKDPYLDSNSLLIVEGYYPTTPSQVHFNLKYIFEPPEWKLFGIYVNTKQPEETEQVEEVGEQSKAVPPMNELITLTNNAVMALGIAINKDDFSGFYNSISQLWQSQTNANELRDIFKQFIEKNIDLTTIKNVTPVYSDKPQLNKDELLILKGYYPAKPSAVYFELKFIYEYPKWKLFGININV
jgi:hypothetical protein